MSGVRFSHRPLMEEKVQNLEKEVGEIKQRNLRVEADKAWETSYFRILLISIIIYIIELRYFIRSGNYFLNALITTIGFLISVQSFSFIKKWWIKKHEK